MHAQHTRDEATGDVDRNRHFNNLESYLFIKQKKQKQVKPCSRDSEKPCGYRVEVPQHSEASQRYPKYKRRQLRKTVKQT